MRSRAVITLLVVLSGAAIGAEPILEPQTFTSERLNATYRDMGGDIAPVTVGPLTVRLSSPSHSLTLRSHEIVLTPRDDGSHRFLARVNLLGKAVLIATLESSVGSTGDVRDEVLVPGQDVVVEGRADLRRVDGGYVIIPRELPEFVEISMQSRLGNQLVSMCEMLTVLLPGMDCSGVGNAFGIARLPMPEPGTEHFLEATLLTAEEIEWIDDYLDRAPSVAD